jgi:activator of 2-hydroxyglutaryl-CoA dehydratase
MLTMGIDIGSRSAQCVIFEDGQLLTYGYRNMALLEGGWRGG